MKEPITTRLEKPLRQRLRVFVAVNGSTVEDVVSAALDAHLPALTDMVRPGLPKARRRAEAGCGES
jgi:hypothetical protein